MSSTILHPHLMAHRLGISFIAYNADTVLLMTRHHRPIPSKGYLHPVTSSNWLVFASSVALIMMFMHFGNSLIKGKVDLINALPLLCMFHYEENSYMMPSLRTGKKKLCSHPNQENYFACMYIGKAILLLCSFIYFSFVNAYNQDFRSSTIEPFFESLPDHIREINPRTNLVVQFEALNIANGLRHEPMLNNA